MKFFRTQVQPWQSASGALTMKRTIFCCPKTCPLCAGWEVQRWSSSPLRPVAESYLGSRSWLPKSWGLVDSSGNSVSINVETKRRPWCSGCYRESKQCHHVLYEIREHLILYNGTKLCYICEKKHYRYNTNVWNGG